MKVAICNLNGRDGHEAGRELLRFLYRQETGKDHLPPLQVTQRGKPFLPGKELHFSISHTNRHAVCVLARCPVGIDAEELDRPLRFSIVQRALSDTELLQYQQAPDKRRAFLTFWVLKEAAAKLSGVGLTGFPNQTHFSLDDPRVRQWNNCLIALMSEDDPEGETFYVV